jgi:hypothetical protein
MSLTRAGDSVGDGSNASPIRKEKTLERQERIPGGTPVVKV